ncbi:alpha/beta family hydrolase [Ornithinimicrobium cavernae]|uniref:alpha/beta hydrolase family protein n=1 Tax=Ornithinimicrobium cavernae TaxID=2666047 RepID=UPI000D68F2D7|nr:alpha/beta family hydrolase [Ornithinimicrobium cavernae]
MIAEPTAIDTSQGPAAVRVHAPTAGDRGTIVLGHGAGGALGSWPKDLQSVLSATAHGWTVVLVEQPWRLAGRKVATRPPTLDAAWRELLPVLTGVPLPRPLVVGGRSAGARVACRTSPGDPEAGLPRADGVLCLAFPLHPPGRPDRSRAPELATPVRLGIPTLVVQGSADPFGSPTEVRESLAAELGTGEPATASLHLVEVPGNHSPSRDQGLVTRTVLHWLEQLG